MIQRQKRIKPTTAKRAAERRQYAKQSAAYLAAHPYDQITIALHGLNEDSVRWHGTGDSTPVRVKIPSGIVTVQRSNQIHHRNKGFGARLLDERWWMATCAESHDFVERNKGVARELGLLLPIQADADGKWGAGNSALTTPELMKARAAR